MREKKGIVGAVLALVFLAGLLVRLAGIGYDGLIPLNHDEQIHLKTARYFASGELNPRAIWEGEIFRYAYYPWLSAYIFAGVLAGVQAAGGLALSLASAGADLLGLREANGALVTVTSKCLLAPATALAVGRVAVALFGALTVLVLYRAGRDLMGRWGAVLGGAFLAFNGYHIANCHWMKNDVIAAFFLTVAFFFCVRIWTRGRRSDYLLAAVFSVLAFNVKWYNAPVFGLFAVAHLLRATVPDRRPAWKRLFPGRLFAAVLLGAAVFALTWPLLLFEPGFVFDNIARVSRDTSSRGMFGSVGTYAQLGFWEIRFHNLVNFVLFSSGMVSGMGWPVLLLGAGGLVAGLFSGRRGLLLAAFPALYLVSAILVASPGIRYQDTIPLYPFFSLGAAWLVVKAAARIGRRRSWLVGGLLAAAVLVPYVRSALRLDYGYWQNSVKYYAGRWAQRNIPPGSLIVKESKTIPLSPGRYREQRVRAFWGVSLEKLVKGGVDYIITSGRQEHRALERFGLFGPDHPFSRFYRELPAKFELIKEFDLGEIPYRGGTTKVWSRRREAHLAVSGIDSGFLRAFQGDHATVSPDVLFLDDRGRCQGNTVFLVPPESSVSRLLVTSTPLEAFGVKVVNGPRPGFVKIVSGSTVWREKLEAGESRLLIVPASRCFPWIRNSYRVEVTSPWSTPVLAALLPDPLRLGRELARIGAPAARHYLGRAATVYPNDWYALLLWGEPIPPEQRTALDRLRAADPAAWGGLFRELTGYEVSWLETRAGRTWKARPGGEPWPGTFHLPPGEYSVSVAGGPDVRLLFSRDGKEETSWTPAGSSPLRFRVGSFGESLRLTVAGPAESVTVSPSLRAWMADELGWTENQAGPGEVHGPENE